jgi:hypothetical protein
VDARLEEGFKHLPRWICPEKERNDVVIEDWQ